MVTAFACNETIVEPVGASWRKLMSSAAVVPDIIDIEQAYFWTSSWQAWEREADQDLVEGRYADFPDVNSLLNDLHAAETDEE